MARFTSVAISSRWISQTQARYRYNCSSRFVFHKYVSQVSHCIGNHRLRANPTKCLAQLVGPDRYPMNLQSQFLLFFKGWKSNSTSPFSQFAKLWSYLIDEIWIHLHAWYPQCPKRPALLCPKHPKSFSPEIEEQPFSSKSNLQMTTRGARDTPYIYKLSVGTANDDTDKIDP